MINNFFSNNKPNIFTFQCDGTNPDFGLGYVSVPIGHQQRWFSSLTANTIFTEENKPYIYNISNEPRLHRIEPTYPNSDIKTISVEIDSFQNIDSILLTYNAVYGDLDLSMFSKLGGVIWLNSNTNLSAITFPDTISSATNITEFKIYSNSSIETLDISMFNKLGGDIWLYSNTNLTGITFPTTIDTGATNISTLYVSGNDLRELDISMFNKLGGAILCYDNINLSAITMPSITELTGDTIDRFNIYNTAINQSFEIGVNKFIPTIIEIHEAQLNRTNQYNTVKSIYDNKSTYLTGTTKTLDISTYSISPLQAPTGYVLDGSDGTIITPTNDTERLQAIREMLYVLENQTSGGTTKYNWNITI